LCKLFYAIHALFNILKKLKMYIINILFYGCVPQKPYKMLSVPSFKKG